MRLARLAAAAALLAACSSSPGPAGPPGPTGPALTVTAGGGVAGDGSAADPLRVDLAAICSPGNGCAAAEFVACGSPVLDGCGQPCGALTGTACPGGDLCRGGACVAQLPRSCAEVLAANAGAPSQDYEIDPDGPGGHPAVLVYCDMSQGGFTLVLNVYDTAGDDAPNTPDWVAAGWEQAVGGGFHSPVSRVRKAYGAGVSSALPPDLVRAMWRPGQSQLKFCLVALNDASELCKSTVDASLTVASAPVNEVRFANLALTRYLRGSIGCPSDEACDAAYTYGRLAGLPGSRNDYASNGFAASASPAFCVPRTPGLGNEFGSTVGGMCENPDAGWVGVWHGWGSGISYRPWIAADNELGNANGPNPVGTNLQPTGFRVWIK